MVGKLMLSATKECSALRMALRSGEIGGRRAEFYEFQLLLRPKFLIYHTDQSKDGSPAQPSLASRCSTDWDFRVTRCSARVRAQLELSGARTSGATECRESRQQRK